MGAFIIAEAVDSACQVREVGQVAAAFQHRPRHARRKPHDLGAIGRDHAVDEAVEPGHHSLEQWAATVKPVDAARDQVPAGKQFL
jgi:hypothetical protein